MIPLLEEKREEIAAICRKYGVTRLEVFGSAANGRFDPARSDVDLLYVFAPRDFGYAAAFFGLEAELEALLGRKVDLVAADFIRNPFFRQSVDRSRQLVYAA